MADLTPTAQMYDAMASDWEPYGEPLTSAFIAPMLDHAAVGLASRLIDVAAGTGALAVAAAERGSNVLAIDIAPAMVARTVARLRPYPHAEARVMNAQFLDVDDAVFDVATSLFGITCADDWRAALSEMARVVRPGGMVALSHWADPKGPGPTRLMVEALGRLDCSGGMVAASGVSAHSEESLRRDLENVGLVDVEIIIRRGSSTWPPADRIMAEMDTLFRYLPAYASLTEEQRDRLRPEVIDIFSPYAVAPGGALRIDDQALLAFARRPA